VIGDWWRWDEELGAPQVLFRRSAIRAGFEPLRAWSYTNDWFETPDGCDTVRFFVSELPTYELESNLTDAEI
jgi:hypothetical protein